MTFQRTEPYMATRPRPVRDRMVFNINWIYNMYYATPSLVSRHTAKTWYSFSKTGPRCHDNVSQSVSSNSMLCFTVLPSPCQSGIKTNAFF